MIHETAGFISSNSSHSSYSSSHSSYKQENVPLAIMLRRELDVEFLARSLNTTVITTTTTKRTAPINGIGAERVENGAEGRRDTKDRTGNESATPPLIIKASTDTVTDTYMQGSSDEIQTERLRDLRRQLTVLLHDIADIIVRQQDYKTNEAAEIVVDMNGVAASTSVLFGGKDEQEKEHGKQETLISVFTVLHKYLECNDYGFVRGDEVANNNNSNYKKVTLEESEAERDAFDTGKLSMDNKDVNITLKEGGTEEDNEEATIRTRIAREMTCFKRAIQDVGSTDSSSSSSEMDDGDDKGKRFERLEYIRQFFGDYDRSLYKRRYRHQPQQHLSRDEDDHLSFLINKAVSLDVARLLNHLADELSSTACDSIAESKQSSIPCFTATMGSSSNSSSNQDSGSHSSSIPGHLLDRAVVALLDNM